MSLAEHALIKQDAIALPKFVWSLQIQDASVPEQPIDAAAGSTHDTAHIGRLVPES
jgi:hypothetical protein